MLDSIPDAMDMSLSKLQQMVKDREAWGTAVHGDAESDTTYQLNNNNNSLTPYTKIHSKQIKNLNVRPETTKLLEKNRGSTLFDINHSKILFDPPPRVTEIKTKINKWDLMKLKRFCTAKETINTIKRLSSE